MKRPLLDSSTSSQSVEQQTKWNSSTTILAEAATVAFLLLQLPQIILNTKNLIAGHFEALFAVQWMGQLTSLLGNLSLLSYFAAKRERGAMAVQTVGVLTTLVVLSQLFVAGAMPPVPFACTVVVVIIGLFINLANYVDYLPNLVWRTWKEGLGVGGATVLAQVMWSTFVPYIPHSFVPGIVTCVSTLTLITMENCYTLPRQLAMFTNGISGWTATLLFMWGAIAQMWQNYIDPADIHGLSVFTILLGMIGNSLLVPRALFTRDLMWFTGAAWGAVVQGWGVLLSMYISKALSVFSFLAISIILLSWLAFILIKDSRVYLLPHPWTSLVELATGSRALLL